MIEISKKNLVYFLILLFNLTNLFAQQTNNLQIIWQKTSSESVFTFGRSISSGDVNGDGYSDIIIIGDSVLSQPGHPYLGKCWVFYGGPIIDTVPDIQLLNTEQTLFTSLHSCDINGDGYDDVILGAALNANVCGEVLIFLGGNSMDSTADYILRGSTGPFDCNFGNAVSSGDVNGDGYKDIIVGASGWNDNRGRVYIYFGGPNFDTIPDVILNGGHYNEYEQFGSSVSGSGDVNNDGYDDVIIGARTFGMLLQGRIYIYFGGNPMDTSYDVAMMGEGRLQTIGEFGIDFIRNYQTFDYAIIGSPLWGPESPLGYTPGKIYVLFGGREMDSVPDIVMIGRTNSSWLGFSVSRANISNQMSDAIIAGAPTEPYPPSDSNFLGCAYLWRGEPYLDTIPDAWARGVEYRDYMSAWQVASAGDVDGDGRDEILVAWRGPSSFTGRRVLVCKYTGVGIEENRQPLTAIRLPLEVYPNPARGVLRICCPLSVREVKIYDVTGKIVKTLVEQRGSEKEAESREIRWDLRDEKQRRVANGVYFVEVMISEERAAGSEQRIREIKKIVVTK